MKHYIGIDVGKFALDVHDGTSNASFKNTSTGLKKLLLFLKRHIKEHLYIIFEATGGYEQPLAQALAQAHIAFKRVHPNKVRYFAKAKGYLAKTDQLDAKLLQLFGEAEQFSHSDELIDEATAQLKALVVRREQLIEAQIKESNRLDKIVNPIIEASLIQHIQWLKTQIADLEKQIKDYVKQQPALLKAIHLLSSIKGIGFLTGVYLITHVPEIGQLEHAQLAALIGLAPMNADSGKKRGKRRIQGGRAAIRKVLYMAALSAIKSNPDIKQFYQRLRNKGKLFKIAITAAMRKLLILANSVAKRGTPWQAIKMIN